MSDMSEKVSALARELAKDRVAMDIEMSAKAPLNSPVFTGTPTAPTPDSGDSTTRVATTAFVQNAASTAASDKLGKDENAVSATKLQTARTIQTNLASTAAASFDGSANVSPGVTGTLPVANGGTGKTTAVDAANAFINALSTGTATPSDADYYVCQYADGGTTTTTYHRRPTSAIWDYINGKISAVLGLTVSNYAGLAAKATADASGNAITTYVKGLSVSGTTITYTKGDGSTGTITTQDTNTTYGAATASALGLVKIGSNISVSSGTISLSKANVTSALGYTPPTSDTKYSVMGAATASAAGTQGLVPAPAAGKQTSFLRGDGTWVVPTNTTYSAGTGISLSGTTFSNSGVRSISAGSTANVLSVNTNGTTTTITINNVANATAATKATKDGSGNTITTYYAPKASPALTGKPTAPTAAEGTSTTQIATTAFVQTAVQNASANSEVADGIYAAFTAFNTENGIS